ncbi:MAG: DUF2089 family protein [Gammaproteobacteria bacterium]
MPFKHNRCSYCDSDMYITRLTCSECGLSHGGDFHTPRLYRLDAEDQRFIELFVLASGSLKRMAELLEVSYPTVRSRLDTLIGKLENEKQQDEKHKEKILEDIETGRIPAKQGMRMIDAL